MNKQGTGRAIVECIGVMMIVYVLLSVVVSIGVRCGMVGLVGVRRPLAVVEIVHGEAVSVRDDGQLNGVDNTGYYIAYSPERVSVGDRVDTLILYNPLTNYTDDILIRWDMCIISND